jgi:hypothetical protein
MKTSNNAPTNLSYPADLKTELGLLVDERGIYRESVRSTEIGERVLAGRNIAPDLAALNRVAGIAIRPVQDIDATGTRISGGNLSDTDGEFGHLAGVLNSAFARLETPLPNRSSSRPTLPVSCASPNRRPDLRSPNDAGPRVVAGGLPRNRRSLSRHRPADAPPDGIPPPARALRRRPGREAAATARTLRTHPRLRRPDPAHGGTIDVMSGAGHGTVFTVRLPRGEDTASRRPG